MRNPVPVSSATIHVREGMDGKVLAPSTAAAVWERKPVVSSETVGHGSHRVHGKLWARSTRERVQKVVREDGPKDLRKDANPKREDASVRAWVEGTPRKLDVLAVATRWVRDARPEQGLEAEKRGTSVPRDNGEEAGSLETGHPLGSGRASKGKGTLGGMSGSRRKSAPRQETERTP